MTSIGLKAQGKSIKRAVLTESLLQPELSGGEAVRLERIAWCKCKCYLSIPNL
jgi:hypothetical protein